jgi:hypothetical protein
MDKLHHPRVCNLSGGALFMVRIAKKATQDGTFTIYLDMKPMAWGLTSSAADALIKQLLGG